eukprot:GHVT01018943.1.p1 GENE.GHVT01018943.1~~GHVT01018943.1.p1  ORF type:complete len:239 (-),score=67.85 GHVT01018943.1:17-733(-)
MGRQRSRAFPTASAVHQQRLGEGDPKRLPCAPRGGASLRPSLRQAPARSSKKEPSAPPGREGDLEEAVEEAEIALQAWPGILQPKNTFEILRPLAPLPSSRAKERGTHLPPPQAGGRRTSTQRREDKHDTEERATNTNRDRNVNQMLPQAPPRLPRPATAKRRCGGGGGEAPTPPSFPRPAPPPSPRRTARRPLPRPRSSLRPPLSPVGRRGSASSFTSWQDFCFSCRRRLDCPPPEQ